MIATLSYPDNTMVALQENILHASLDGKSPDIETRIAQRESLRIAAACALLA